MKENCERFAASTKRKFFYEQRRTQSATDIAQKIENFRTKGNRYRKWNVFIKG